MTRHPRASVACVATAILFTLAPGDAQAPALVVDGEVGHRLALSFDDLRAMTHQRVDVDQQGARVSYEGVLLTELLRGAGVDIGRAPLQGKALADRRPLLADARDGRPLAGNEGPLRLVVPGDTYPFRSVRQVIRLTVAPVSAPKQPER
jgi:DMSO/TMAO reductase YedYZ molybdopterin-dependent catalytic subunit